MFPNPETSWFVWQNSWFIIKLVDEKLCWFLIHTNSTNLLLNCCDLQRMALFTGDVLFARLNVQTFTIWSRLPDFKHVSFLWLFSQSTLATVIGVNSSVWVYMAYPLIVVLESIPCHRNLGYIWVPFSTDIPMRLSSWLFSVFLPSHIPPLNLIEPPWFVTKHQCSHIYLIH